MGYSVASVAVNSSKQSKFRSRLMYQDGYLLESTCDIRRGTELSKTLYTIVPKFQHGVAPYLQRCFLLGSSHASRGVVAARTVDLLLFLQVFRWNQKLVVIQTQQSEMWKNTFHLTS